MCSGSVIFTYTIKESKSKAVYMPSETEQYNPDFGDNANDKTVAVLKSVAGLVPWAGTALGEIISQIIPNQRIERLEKYLQHLALQLNQMQIPNVQDKIKSAENVDFFEDGAYLAARALSDERMKYIANCVANGIAKDQLDKTREKRVLRLLQDLDDEEILLLNGYCGQTKEAKNVFTELRPEPTCIGSSTEVISEETLFEKGIANLEKLGLIETHYPFAKKGEPLKFDSFGKIQKGQKKITWLGRILLKNIGLIETEI